MRITTTLAMLLALAACNRDADETDTDEADADTDTDSDADTDADTDSDTDADTDSDTDTDTDSDTDTDPAEWAEPDCAEVTGTSAVSWTADDGATLQRTEGDLTGIVYTHLVAMPDVPNLMYAESAGRLLRSTDAGCTWSEVGELTRSPMNLTVGGADRLYAWSDNDVWLQRVDGGVIQKSATAPEGSLVGFGVDSAVQDRVLAGNHLGQLFESEDAGETWSAIGVTPFGEAEGWAYRVEFDPKDANHVVVGSMITGAFVTTDGGQTWTASTGLTDGAEANVFSVEISPVFGSTVWAQGNDGGHTGRHIWKSGDGGLSFEKVVSETEGVKLVNGATLYPHPYDSERVYFVFGTYYDDYGTDLFRYDGGSGVLSMQHNGYDNVSDIAFHPGNGDFMYLGLVSER